MKKRLAFVFVTMMLALFALLIRVYLIQKENSAEYNQRILSQQRYDSQTIPYRRGDIVDRNGTHLATSDKVYHLIIDPYQITSSAERYLEPTVDLLHEVFGYDKDELRRLITENSSSLYIRYAKDLSYEIKERFESRQQEVNDGFALDKLKTRVHGVWFEDAYVRTYPYNQLACNVIGFSDKEGNEGTGGIEQYYNDELIGTAGREYGYLTDESNLERVIKPAKNGHTIVSTIDINIQSIVERHLRNWEEEVGSKMAAILVMDPGNGEVLAMATSRSFDLNNPRDVSRYYSEEEFSSMTESQQAEALSQLWRNYIVSDTYEPGSTGKIFTVSAALEEGVIEGHESYNCDGFQIIVDGEKPVRCVNRNGHGNLTVTEAIMVSCNDAMMQMAASLRRERYVKYMENFGFGAKTGIDLPGEADTSNLVYTLDNMRAMDLATNSFGQNYNTTMIQLSAAFCSVINGGYYYEPHVVKQIVNSEGYVIKDVEPLLVKETVSPHTAAFINNALRKTVDLGTGAAAKVKGYSIGGKTGTAELLPRGGGNYLVSFAGAAPAENPEVFCYVVIEEPKVEEQANSAFASGLFSAVMAELLPYMNIYPEDREAVEPVNPYQRETEDIEGEGEGSGSVEKEKETAIQESRGDAQEKEPLRSETAQSSSRIYDTAEVIRGQTVEEEETE